MISKPRSDFGILFLLLPIGPALIFSFVFTFMLHIVHLQYSEKQMRLEALQLMTTISEEVELASLTDGPSQNLSLLLDSIRTESTHFAYIEIRNTDGVVLASSGTTPQVEYVTVEEPLELSRYQPDTLQARKFVVATIRVLITQKTIKENVPDWILEWLFTFILALAFSIALSTYLFSRLRQESDHLYAFARRITMGDYSPLHRFPRGMLAPIEQTLNSLAKRLKVTQKERDVLANSYYRDRSGLEEKTQCTAYALESLKEVLAGKLADDEPNIEHVLDYTDVTLTRLADSLSNHRYTTQQFTLGRWIAKAFDSYRDSHQNPVPVTINYADGTRPVTADFDFVGDSIGFTGMLCNSLHALSHAGAKTIALNVHRLRFPDDEFDTLRFHITGETEETSTSIQSSKDPKVAHYLEEADSYADRNSFSLEFRPNAGRLKIVLESQLTGNNPQFSSAKRRCFIMSNQERYALLKALLMNTYEVMPLCRKAELEETICASDLIFVDLETGVWDESTSRAYCNKYNCVAIYVVNEGYDLSPFIGTLNLQQGFEVHWKSYSDVSPSNVVTMRPRSETPLEPH